MYLIAQEITPTMQYTFAGFLLLVLLGIGRAAWWYLTEIIHPRAEKQLELMDRVAASTEVSSRALAKISNTLDQLRQRHGETHELVQSLHERNGPPGSRV